MSNIHGTIECNEEAFPSFDVSDEAVERAAGDEAVVNYTYYNCTGYGYCPGY